MHHLRGEIKIKCISINKNNNINNNNEGGGGDGIIPRRTMSIQTPSTVYRHCRHPKKTFHTAAGNSDITAKHARILRARYRHHHHLRKTIYTTTGDEDIRIIAIIQTPNKVKRRSRNKTTNELEKQLHSATGIEKRHQQQQQQQQSVNDNYGSATIRKKQNREDELLMWNNANENSLPSLTTSVIPIINEVNANSGGGDDVGSRSSSTSWKESLASKIVASSSKLEHRNRQQPQPQPQPQQ